MPGSNNQFYPPAVDPYDPKHLLVAGHGVSFLAESVDGAKTWQSVPLDPAMGPTGGINFINTGDAVTTRTTWLWLSQLSGGVAGTWRIANGTPWSRVETNEHPAGISQIYQPDTSGVVFMAGLYSKNGYGVFRSGDYGATWAHVGDDAAQERVVFGTSKNVCAMMGSEFVGDGTPVALQVAPQPGATGWTKVQTPTEMNQGPLQAEVTSDGKNAILLLAGWTSGIWRYVEP